MIVSQHQVVTSETNPLTEITHSQSSFQKGNLAGTIKQLADVDQLVRVELIRERHQQRLNDLVTRLKDEHTWLIDESLFELP